MLAASLSDVPQTQHQKVFSLYAGATKGVTSHAAHRGLWHDAGATKS